MGRRGDSDPDPNPTLMLNAGLKGFDNQAGPEGNIGPSEEALQWAN